MQAQQEKAKAPIPAINFHPTKGSLHFIGVPRWWVDEFFGHTCGQVQSGETIRKSTRLPNAFWKYTLNLWRWLSVPIEKPVNSGKYVFETSISARECPMRRDAFVQWTAAFCESGVMQVKMGQWTARNDEPTQFTYNPTTSHNDWRAFFVGLEFATNHLKVTYRATAVGNTQAWRVLVAREVLAQRKALNLPDGNTLTGCLQWKDYKGRPVARLLEDGSIEPIFYGKAQAAGADD